MSPIYLGTGKHTLYMQNYKTNNRNNFRNSTKNREEEGVLKLRYINYIMVQECQFGKKNNGNKHLT